MNGYLGAMRRYATFSGRSSRAEFWSFTFLSAALIFVTLVIDAAYISGPRSQSQPFAGLVVLLHILPSLAVTVRRLHDTGRSGWLLLIGVVPLIGTIVLVVWALQAGTPGPNRFSRELHAGGASQSGNVASNQAQPVARDLIAEIERLAQLRASGSLSDAEFEVLKAQTLGRA